MPWGYIAAALIGSLIVAYIFQPKMKITNQKPSDIDDFRIPTAEEGREIPVIFGTKDIKSANVVWYGDLKTEDIRVKVRSSTLFSSSKYKTVGYKYFLGMHMVLCHGPVNAVVRIEAGELLAWSGSVTANSLIYIDKPDLFGGTEREGGIQGYVSVDMGASTQDRDAYLGFQLAATTSIPAFRGVVALILEQIYITAMSPYIKPWAIRVSRTTITSGGSTIWNPSKAQINIGLVDSPGMNPVHIIYEALTDTSWGLGYPTSDIDESSFLSAANTVWGEKFGLSLMWDNETSLESFIQTISEHIDSAVFIDRETGKFKIKLIRDDYDESTLTVFGPNEISEMSGYSRPAIGDLVNSLVINYWDATTGKKGSVGYQELALIQIQNSINATTIDYPGIMDRFTAQKAALRDLKGLASPLLTSNFTCNRLANDLEIGSVFKLYWPEYSEEITVMRVTALEYSEGSSDEITIACLEDIFSTPSLAFSEPTEQDDWVDNRIDPGVVTSKRIVEAPYYFLGSSYSFSEIDSQLSLQPSTGVFIVFAVRSEDALTARLYMSPTSSNFELVDDMDFCPTGVLSVAVGLLDEYLYFSEYDSLSGISTNTLGYIGNEIVSITEVGVDFVRVKRGVLDTVPSTHSIGGRFYAWQNYTGSDEEGYTGSTTRYAKVQAINSIGSSSLSSTTSVNVSLNSRMIRPYPPGYVRINNTFYPTDPVVGIITISWKHRSRLAQIGSTLIDTTNSTDFGPEVGTTYRLRILSGAVVVRDISAIEGTSWSDELDSLPADTYTVELRSVRDGYDSWQFHIFTFVRG